MAWASLTRVPDSAQWTGIFLARAFACRGDRTLEAHDALVATAIFGRGRGLEERKQQDEGAHGPILAAPSGAL
jgi:hypothetical protein